MKKKHVIVLVKVIHLCVWVFAFNEPLFIGSEKAQVPKNLFIHFQILFKQNVTDFVNFDFTVMVSLFFLLFSFILSIDFGCFTCSIWTLIEYVIAQVSIEDTV